MRFQFSTTTVLSFFIASVQFFPTNAGKATEEDDGFHDSEPFYIHSPFDFDADLDGETSNNGCGPDQFYCDHDKGGKCIPKKWVCDHEYDCEDRTDENEKCPARTCGPGQFHCRLTGICIPMGYRCDREVDCGFTVTGIQDRSDEDDAHCNLTLNCPSNQHKCLTVDTCVDLSHFCNSKPDCPDLSDEGPFCHTHYNITCKYQWIPTPDAGPRCFCPSGKRPKGPDCVDDDECLIEREGGFSPCDQLCSNLESGYNCSCVPGYKLNKKSECIAQNVPAGESVSFLIANGETAMHVDMNLTKTIGKIEGKLIHALDFDHRNGTVCWVSAIGKEIRYERRVLQCTSVDHFDRNHTWSLDADYALEGVEQMAKDWVSGNWYFIDDSYDRLFICNWNVSICQTLLSGMLDKPKDLALDPSVGYIFVTDWSSLHPGLIRLNMDGSNVIRLVNLSIIYPYGLTLDYPKRMVFWLDNYLEYIHGIDYEGQFKRRVVASGHQMKSLYALTTFEKNLYASDYFKPTIVRITKTNGTQTKTISGRDFQRVYTIKAFHRQRQPDVIHPCGKNNGGCEHLCMVQYLEKRDSVSGKNSKYDVYSGRIRAAKCACRDGYRLEANGRCVKALKYPFILFGKTAPGTLMGIPLDPPKAGYQTIQPVRHLQRPTAVALLVAEETMFFSDAANFTIQKRKISGTKSQVVIDEGISNCEGLAIDWISRNLYWSDEGLLTISVARMDNPSFRKVIAEGNMSHPRAIAVHPKAGYVFWTDWADLSDITAGRWLAKIERANLDGRDRRALIKSQVHWPNGLAIDYEDEPVSAKKTSQGWLYWCDAYMDRIERVRLDGTDRQVVVDSQQVAHPYGLAYFNGHLYWTEFRKGLILRINVDEHVRAAKSLKDRPAPVEMYQDASPLFEVHIFDKNGQKGGNMCSTENGGCQHFCFYDSRQKSVSCECADGYRPTKSDSKLCERDPDYESRRRCLDTQFECKRNHRCIDMKYVCDSDNDCKDFSDEDTGKGGPCENHTCTEDQFHCKSNRCIPRAWLCDGDRDCQGGEDETNCSVSDCGQNKFQCKVSKKCILSDWLCDHEYDCGPGDTSDEHENCTYPKCRNDQFECQNKQCIPVGYVCDGDRDCRDGSDEMHCDINCIQGQEFRCTPQSPCISVYRKCDGFPDCPDGSDEKECVRNALNCTKNQFKCASSGECIRSIFRCDGDADCIDGSDEAGCPKLNCQPHSHFECRDGSRCIVRQWVCDGFNDCADHSDEENCTQINPSLNKCVAPNFACKNDTASCLPAQKLCDGRVDCGDGSDEGFLCLDKMCEKNASSCMELCYNSPSGFVCGCQSSGFKLQPDGRTCAAQDPCSKWGVCSQYCQPTGSHYFCWCDKDYELATDKFTCKSVGSTKPYIIFSNRHELRLVGLRDGITTSLAVNLRNTIAIDYFYQDETKSLIFWTDIATDKIYRGTLENFALSDVKIIVEHGIATAEGIAVDWIAHNLYWVDSSLDQIEVAKFDGRWRTTVVSGQMQNLRAIAVDPRKGFMFWTDWEESNPRIERCTLAGNERIHNLFSVTIVQGGGWPNGLTADYIAERLYWIDAKSDSIHTITYEGKDYRQVLRGHDFLSHPFAIAIFEDKMYWTDWRVNSIVRANKWNGSEVQIIQGTSAQPFDIQIIHPSRQPQRDKNPCGPGNGGCSHLCLLNSNVSSVCKCPYLMKLSSDNKTCQELNRALIFAQPMAITGVDLQPPYANVIPVLANAVVENVSAVDVDMANKMIYWTDIKAGAIRRSYLNGSNMQTVVDSGLPNPYGIAIDWLSRNLYFTSYDTDGSVALPTAKISVSTLNGEFRKVLIRRGHNESGNEGLRKPSSIAVDPVRGYMYWIDSGKEPPTVQYAFMDGSQQRVLPTDALTLRDPTSLSIDYRSNRLYWADRATRGVHYCQLARNECSKLSLPSNVKPSSIAVGNNVLYFYDESLPQESYVGLLETDENGVVRNTHIIRNRTSRVRNLKIFDPKLQDGDNACRNSTLYRPCSQLCSPLPGYKKGCSCATGYQPLVSDSNSCEGVTKFVLYADANRIGGLDDSPHALGADLLAPLSQVQHPTSLDFHAVQERIYWADMEANRIVSIRRDLTDRTVIIDDPVAKVHSLAVDWIADNIYWTNRLAGTDGAGVIEVARLNGSHRRIVVHEPKDTPRSIHVDPRAGYLFWLNSTGIQRTHLDGSERRRVVTSINATDLAVDLHTESICWLDSNRTRISCTNYDGLKYRTVFNSPQANAYFTAFTVNDNNVYWSDRNDQQGSIMTTPIGKEGAYRTIHLIKVRMQSTINDLKVFDRRAQSGTNPCQIDNGGCEHLCLYRGRRLGHVCECSFSKLNPDNKTCSHYDAFIVYSRVQRIDFAFLDEEEDPNTPFPAIDNRVHVRNVIGLAYDYENRRLFYSDIQLGSIMAAEFRTENKTHQVYEIATNQGSVEGLAYDYIHQDLYWTSYSNASINRASVKPGTHPVKPTTVLQLASTDKPRGIAVDPCEMQIYWTNWNEGKPTIERSFLSGAMRQTVIQTDIKTPNALTIDFHSRKLYWSDARLDKIERCELDGTNRRVISSGLPSHVFGIAVYGDYLYWTDWIMRAVVRISKYTGADFAYVKRNFTRQPMGIIVVANDSSKCGVDACSKGHSVLCQDICALDDYGRPKCKCRGNRVLQLDNVTCADPEPTCDPKSMFQCESGKCIPYEFTCDGAKECPEGDDEEAAYCANRKCREGFFRCKNGQCVNATTAVCNGVNNCGDFSDELGCPCDKDTQFRCTSGMCVPKNFRCNDQANCNDASDEMGCPRRNCSSISINSRPMINCNYTTQCILPSWICDGHNDCWDNSDEAFCAEKVSPILPECLPTMFQCATTRRCIPAAWRCNGEKDCSDGSDEENCKAKACSPKREFQCKDNVCILNSWTCDGTPDCSNGEDEDESLCKGGGIKSCSESDFSCSNGHCIPQRWVCDGENDCNDTAPGSDEKNCEGKNLCPQNYFQCKNGQCILSAFYCDRDDDCGDNSDEPSDCAYHSCDPEKQFQCKIGRCIPHSWVCNGIADCKDKSDEEDSICQLRNGSSLCKPKEHQCQNGVCIDEDLVCDSHNDCGDWSDEGPLCNKDECAHMNNPCDHICRDLKLGYECQCREGYSLAADKKTCVDVDECKDSLPCSQLCINRPGSYACGCHSGYTLYTDGKSCKQSSGMPAELVVSNRYFVWRYTLDGRSKGHVLSNLTNAVAVDYDWLEQRVYWSDVTSSSSRIGRVFFNGTGWEVLHTHTVRNPDGLAVDWAGRNLYWCDKGVDTIEVSRLDGRYRKVLMRQQFLQEPRAIIVDPHSQLLFWSDWGENAHIGRMGMDGSKPKLIVEKSLKWPNALTLDHVTKFIFWGDAGQDYIGMSDYDGNRVRVITTEINHIFSIAVFEDFLYWTDWDGRIERALKYTGKSRSVVVTHLEHRPMGIRVVHPLLQPKLEFFNNPCANGGWCSNLCLLSPESQRRTCACPEGFKKQGRLDCVPDCKPSEFVCENTYKCLPLWWRCDGQDDCGDGQDEMYFKPGACPPFNCTAGEFQCYDGAKCVQPSRICDGTEDCDDGSDEGSIKNFIDCETYQCISGQWKCPNSTKCISDVRRCDGRPDCPNGQDEMDCLHTSCPPTYFRCSTKGQGSSMCLPRVFFCDSELDCPDGSDEPPNCRNRTCSEREFKCPEGRCIPLSARCDGDKDCKLGEDELNCVNTTCDQSYFRCGDGRCIPASWRCDSESDCADASDEQQCEDALNCTSNEFRCADGRRCIGRSLLCNGKNDCTDGSDEAVSAGCSKTSVCHPTQFACSNKRQCIPMAWKCDGEVDCFDGSDETASCSGSCNSSQFQCTGSKRCINSLFQCDGQNDCEDASDEQLVRCMVRPCPPGFLKCKSGKCFPAHLRCDGVRHCQDGSDEIGCRAFDFTCDNGRGIGKDYICDGYDDCGDGSDETKERCSPDPCGQFGVCSQKCTIDKNTRQHKCYCDSGYVHQSGNTSCKAFDGGLPSIVMLAGDQEIRYVKLRKHQHFDAIPMAGERMQDLAVTVFRENGKGHAGFVVYWTDPHKGELSYRRIPLETMNGEKYDAGNGQPRSANNTLISDGVHPRGIALDYIHGNLYWADSGREIIGVINVSSNGGEYRNLISWNLDVPYAVAVAPRAGLLFWTDVGPRRKIEASFLDGSGRRLLVNKDVVYPTGLAVDQPNGRLYWADPKTSSIETISFDGTDRRLVKTFPFGGIKPMYLDVFEDTIYFTTYINHEVLMMSKFGNGTMTTLMDPLPYPANIIVWHESQEIPVETACSEQPCPSDAMCLPGRDPSLNRTCLCRENEVYRDDVNMCFVSMLPHLGTCPMVCHNGGQCVVTTNRKLECACRPGFTGPTCQEQICYGLCLNGGTCVVDERRSTASCMCPIEYTGDRCQSFKCAGRCRTEHGECYVEKETEKPKCRCHTGWAGDQCDTRSDICNNYCYNNGTCYVLSGNKAQCKCPMTHRGERCQQCYELQCMHDGVCIQNTCICKAGYQGRQCEVDTCQGYCANDAKCVRTPEGPKCKCSPRFSGDKCQKDKCRGLCQNGGFCREIETGVDCLCTSRFAGDTCESSVECSEYCLNGARCDVDGNEFICRCSAGYNGTRCENTLACNEYCDNGALCKLNENGRPVCDCPIGLAGDKCQDISANTCADLQCYNGDCEDDWEEDESNYNTPDCKCKLGWKGLVCNVPDCDQYCLNGGTCVVEKTQAACRCIRGFYGNRCEHKFTSKIGEPMSDDDIPGTVSAVVVPLVLVMLLGMLIFYLVFVRRRNAFSFRPFNQFKHSRMHDVDEVQNPVYLRGGDDEDDLDALVSPAEESVTFSNPMYDSVYNDTVISDGGAGAGGVNVGGTMSPADTSEEHDLLGKKARLEMNKDDFS